MESVLCLTEAQEGEVVEHVACLQNFDSVTLEKRVMYIVILLLTVILSEKLCCYAVVFLLLSHCNLFVLPD